MSVFKGNEILTSVERVKQLAALLAECPDVTRFDAGEHKEAWALADSLAELEKLMREFLASDLPRLAGGGLPSNEVSGALLDIGEVFRRVLYHMIEQPKYYRYLVPAEMLAGDLADGGSGDTDSRQSSE
jgi:hypothetical protein